MKKLGATGKYPHGKLNPDDEGELTMAIAFDPKDGLIHVEFGKPVAWLALPPATAIQFAKAIIQAAAQAPEAQ